MSVASDRLSPQEAFGGLSRPIRALVAYEPETLWAQDTATLPHPLRRYRARLRRFARETIRPRALEADLDPHGPAAPQVLAAAAREGLLTDLLPWPFGSMSWKLVRQPFALVQSLKMEELGAVDAGFGVMLGAHGLGTLPLLLSGDLGTVRRFVRSAYRRTRAGRPTVLAFAITEPAGGSDVEETEGARRYAPGTVACRRDGGWLLTGRKVFISGGDLADAITVFAALEGEGMSSWTCFLVEKTMPGVSVARVESKMGQRVSGAAEIVFDDVFVPDDHVVGGLRNGWALNRATLNFSRIPVGALALGIARGAMEAAFDFVRRTRLAGRPLLDYQDVQIGIADMIVETAAMRALVWRTASRWTARQAQASIAKVFSSDRAMRVCERAMDLVGNHAVLHANRVEKHLRDARVTQIFEGTNQINRLAVIEDQTAAWSAGADSP